ncbi:MAG TPA: class I SAM-dependent methyltransferase [Casimicrobiaceae bacterium]|nr:class I SAM-dependent methyltransferase [Casimicrobiaceae bacterium]
MSVPGVPHDGALGPSPWIVRFAPLAAAGARVLDIACGRGRHTVFFASRGCRVAAVDRDPEALAALSGVTGVNAIACDLESGKWPFAAERFDVVVVTNYLHRPLLPRLVQAVADDGLLLYETFAVGNEAYGRPSNPDFLLAEGELLQVVRAALTIVAFEQGAVAGERPTVLQRLAAVGRGRQWPPPLPL